MESEEVENVEGETIEEIQEQEGEVLHVPVSHSQIQGEENFDDSGNVLQLQVKGKYYKQTYRSAWEQMPDFKGWLRGVQGEPTRAYCTYCQKTLHAHRLSLLKHTCTIRHQKAAQLHNSRKTSKKPLTDSELSSTEDEGAKLDDKYDPPFKPESMKAKRSKRSNFAIKTETPRNKRSFKSSDIEYYNEDDHSSPSSVYEYKLPQSIINLKKQRRMSTKEPDTSPSYKRKTKETKNNIKIKKENSNSSVHDEVADAINQLQSLSDSIQVKEEDEFDIFGKYVASQLKHLSLLKALRAKQRIYTFLSDLRIAEINETSNSNVNSQSTVPVAYISVPSTASASSTNASTSVVNNTLKTTDT